jgi:L-ribulose-5-phosphate 3-epimerase
MLTRREALRQAAVLAGLVGCSRIPAEALQGEDARYRVGACDWSLGKRSHPESFAIGERLGLDGIQLDLGENPSEFLDPDRRRVYQQAARDHGVEIASLALVILNRVPYKSEPRTEAWVRDSIDVARALDLDVVLLAFFGRNDLKGDPAGQREVVRRLKRVAPKAEDAGVVLGIESWLSAREHRELVDAVGSPSVQVYYDLGNSNKMGYDIYSEIRDLGRDLICEVHAKEYRHLLGRGRIDFPRVRDALDDIGYRGWIHIEGAVPEGAELMEAYRWNTAFLRDVFFG